MMEGCYRAAPESPVQRTLLRRPRRPRPGSSPARRQAARGGEEERLQRFVDHRPDVLTYQTPVLDHDSQGAGSAVSYDAANGKQECSNHFTLAGAMTGQFGQ